MTGDDSAGDGAVPGSPDPQTMLQAEGQAALVLAESILLALVDSGVLSRDQVQEAVEMVIDTKRQMAEEGQQPVVSRAAFGILSAVANSLAAIK
jgi:hypothetical protein